MVPIFTVTLRKNQLLWDRRSQRSVIRDKEQGVRKGRRNRLLQKSNVSHRGKTLQTASENKKMIFALVAWSGLSRYQMPRSHRPGEAPGVGEISCGSTDQPLSSDGAYPYWEEIGGQGRIPDGGFGSPRLAGSECEFLTLDSWVLCLLWISYPLGFCKATQKMRLCGQDNNKTKALHLKHKNRDRMERYVIAFSACSFLYPACTFLIPVLGVQG